MSRKNIHPDLNENYFEKIDTVEKAYWLGFFYADGFISKSEKRCSLVLSASDEDQIDRFAQCVGGDLSLKKFYGPYGKTKKQVHFTVSHENFTKHLVNHGCTYKKTFTIRWPEASLTSRSLELGFLLGFFDGDGNQNSTQITCGSFNFLQDIKSKFEVGKLTESKSTEHALCLGTSLFLEMLDTYRNSMPRKRRTSQFGLTWDSKMKGHSDNLCLNCQKPIWTSSKRCFSCEISRRLNQDIGTKIEWPPLKDLVEEVRKTNFVKVAKKYGVSDNAVRKRLKKRGVDLSTFRKSTA